MPTIVLETKETREETSSPILFKNASTAIERYSDNFSTATKSESWNLSNNGESLILSKESCK